MSTPDPLAKLRRFVPLHGLIILLQAGFLVYALVFGVGQAPPVDAATKVIVVNPTTSPLVVVSPPRIPIVWPLVAGDLVFSGLLLFVLWRYLVRRRG